MSNSNIQQEHYNKTRSKRFEVFFNNPKALLGRSMPMEYFKGHRLVVEKVRKFSSDLNDIKILDLGCGEGSWSVYWAAEGASVTALDISEENINITKLAAKRNGLENIDAIVGDCTDTNLKSDSFDVIVGMAVIHHLTVEQEKRLYPELLRLLKPGGLSIFLEPIQNSKVLDYVRTLVPIFQKHNPRPSRFSKQWKDFIDNDPHPDRPNTSMHYKELLNQYQFSKVSLHEVGILNRLDRLTFNRNIRRIIHDIDYVLQPLIPFNRKLARSIILTMIK
ncbi:MAG: methyltransferase domain-containing protein [Bacteroidetes bacterium]|nr:methyltransferase domain-containing protein [Bacteroidota bacterium]